MIVYSHYEEIREYENNGDVDLQGTYNPTSALCTWRITLKTGK